MFRFGGNFFSGNLPSHWKEHGNHYVFVFAESWHHKIVHAMSEPVTWCITWYTIRFVLSQWEMALQSNAISHWMGARRKSAQCHSESSSCSLSLGLNELRFLLEISRCLTPVNYRYHWQHAYRHGYVVELYAACYEDVSKVLSSCIIHMMLQSPFSMANAEVDLQLQHIHYHVCTDQYLFYTCDDDTDIFGYTVCLVMWWQ